jgi:asparagine synthase (glutamine-hydrolysing)
MSIQFGTCNLDGKPVDPKDLDRVRPVLVPYGPDAEGYLCNDNVGILFRPLHTTKEARNEVQPHKSPSGAVITWDGRLDNREELIGQLGRELSAGSTDLEIVAAAHERWGTGFLAKLIGDWALAVWDPRDFSVILAKDFIGTRHLYYAVEKERVTWCTILDPLVLFAGHPTALEQEYIAGWLSFFPAPHLTPYVGIHSVPPSCFVRLGRGNGKIGKYWDFDPGKRIHYGTDREYEEHFRTAFAESVRRRLRSDNPVLAELSGGMDSSSIVCVADDVMQRGLGDAPRLNTVSYYDDSEPNWNERPYFRRVEERRGRVGCHIDVGSSGSLALDPDTSRFAAAPCSTTRTEVAEKFGQCLISLESRVVLTGFGGDEVAGGVPTPVPELADLLAGAEFRAFAHQLKRWALQKRVPWFHLLSETSRAFIAPALLGIPESRRPAPWLCSNFAKQHRVVLSGYPSRFTLSGAPPSFQESLHAIAALQRQLSCSVAASSKPPYESRHPFLDRDLLEFLYAIPREQLVRPGQRRSLIRRSLRDIVPAEILSRKRKAYVSRAPLAGISRDWDRLVNVTHKMLTASFGIIDSAAFRETLQRARCNQPVAIVILRRTLALEFWLRQQVERGVLSAAPATESDCSLPASKERFERLASKKDLLAS